MKKPFFSILILFTVMILAACGSQTSGEDKKEIEKADQAVYDFIVAQVEGDHELFKKVLMEDAQGVLIDDRHANPDFEEKMGERYEVKRYDSHYNENKLYYYIKFFRPNHDELDYMNVLMVKDDDGNWKSTDIRGIERDEMREAMGDEEPVTVHEMKEDVGSE
ncbi:hypothetical protein [Peribacillus frigoritolerans]|uniref:hypothetical protein n=1 Tax=Peribacillus frigoritolerans TaxID=450367 RepID=UPI00399F452D